VSDMRGDLVGLRRSGEGCGNPLKGSACVLVPVPRPRRSRCGSCGPVWTLGVTLAGYLLGSRVPGIDTYLLPIVAVIIVVP